MHTQNTALVLVAEALILNATVPAVTIQRGSVGLGWHHYVWFCIYRLAFFGMACIINIKCCSLISVGRLRVIQTYNLAMSTVLSISQLFSYFYFCLVKLGMPAVHQKGRSNLLIVSTVCQANPSLVFLCIGIVMCAY